MATVQRDVPFGTAASGSGQQLLCDVYSPSPSAAGFAELPDGQRAGMLVVHGGGWFIGEKEQLEGYARGLSDMGYVCVCNSYRLASKPTSRPELQQDKERWAAEEGKWPSMLHDCKACVRWIRANATTLGISPDHIAVTGNSAGGHLSLMVAGVDGELYPELEGESGTPGVSSAVAACGAVYPPTIISRHAGQNSVAKGIARLVDDQIMPTDHTARDLLAFSPLNYADAEFPPTCILHGNGDSIVAKQVRNMSLLFFIFQISSLMT